MAENKVRTLSMLFVLLLAIGLPMKAQSKPCGSGGHESQAEMNQCAIDEFKNADKRLNETYKELLDKLKSRDRDDHLGDSSVRVRGAAGRDAPRHPGALSAAPTQPAGCRRERTAGPAC